MCSPHTGALTINKVNCSKWVSSYRHRNIKHIVENMINIFLYIIYGHISHMPNTLY